MKKIFLLLFVLFIFVSVYAQDIITLKNGNEIEALVKKISEKEVEYKWWHAQDGQTFILDKSEIFRIKYQNGTVDVFKDADNKAKEQKASENQDFLEQKARAEKAERELAEQKAKARKAEQEIAEQKAREKMRADSITNAKKLLVEQAFALSGIEMIYVEGGTFTMGCTSEQGRDCYNDEKPAHQVTLDSYYIGKYPVTQKQWNKIMGTKSNYRYDNYPVKASWNDIQFFIKELNLQTGENYRLPTEAEWEYAARGGNQSKGYKYSGSNQIDEVAYKRCYNVGNKLANELGIYDMSGNVLERCSDLYGSYSASDQTNPTGASRGVARILRGRGKDCRISNRTHKKDLYNNNAGFRLVLDSEDNKIENKTIADAENHEKRIQEYKKLANTRLNGHYISIGSSCFLSGYYGIGGLSYEYRYKIIGANFALGFGCYYNNKDYLNANIGVKLYFANKTKVVRNLYFNFLPLSYFGQNIEPTYHNSVSIDNDVIMINTKVKFPHLYGIGLFFGYSPIWQVRKNLWIGFNIDGGFKVGYKKVIRYYYYYDHSFNNNNYYDYHYHYYYPIVGGVDLGFVIKFGGKK